jgi:hypothetical protein
MRLEGVLPPLYLRRMQGWQLAEYLLLRLFCHLLVLLRQSLELLSAIPE